MKLSSKKHITIAGFLLILLGLHTGCTKEQIAPAKQSVAFVKYYGHVDKQKGSDLQRTSDGGYIMVGSTNSYSSQDESDIFVVKTDSFGNEEWSAALGKAPGLVTSGTLINTFVRYDEEGIKVVVLPDDAGYVVTGNRTYVTYSSSVSTIPLNPEYKTKVVMYQLDIAGAPISLDGVELRSTTDKTEKVSDMKLDTANGLLRYVLTGYTTDIALGKPIDPNNGAFDKTDIFTVLLNDVFGIAGWSVGVLAYGFVGEDYGVSIQILPDAYLITGTSQKQEYPDDFYDRIIAVKMAKANGVPLNTQFYGDETYDLKGGTSVYDANNNEITIAGMINDEVTNPYVGNAVLLQISEGLIAQTTGTGNSFGFRYYRPTAPTTLPPSTRNYYYPKSIALLPDNGGFVVSMTHEKSIAEHNIAIMKVDENFGLQTGWPFYFGYEDISGGFSTKEVAGTIIPVSEAITGTSQSTLRGYAFTGTFGVGTNNMMGLVKMNSNGTLNP